MSEFKDKLAAQGSKKSRQRDHIAERGCSRSTEEGDEVLPQGEHAGLDRQQKGIPENGRRLDNKRFHDMPIQGASSQRPQGT